MAVILVVYLQFQRSHIFIYYICCFRSVIGHLYISCKGKGYWS